MLYIGRPKLATISKVKKDKKKADFTSSDIYLTPGIISPSQKVITYGTYNLHTNKYELVTNKNYEVLTSKIPDILYWESIENFNRQEFLSNAVTIADRQPELDFYPPSYIFFIAKVGIPFDQKDKVVGCYSTKSIWSEFNNPLIGFGIIQTRVRLYITCPISKDPYLDAIRALVPYNGNLFEVTNFSVLCCYGVPKLCHYVLPEIKWESVSDDPLPSNAFPAGVAPDGEVLYVGRIQHRSSKYENGHSSIGYIVPSKKCLHVALSEELCCHRDYEILVEGTEKNVFEWGVYSCGEVPLNAIVGGTFVDKQLFIGRTVVDNDISLGETSEHEKINLPEQRVSDTQFIGEIQDKDGYLSVPWDGKEYTYQLYEVLMMKTKPMSLQQLCRNVIITTTLGIPHRVDQLSLPNHLKEYCKVATVHSY